MKIHRPFAAYARHRFHRYRLRLKDELKEGKNSKLWKGLYMFFENDCSIKKVLEYEYTRFDGLSVANLIKSGCSPREADLYHPKFDGTSIAVLYSIGLKPNKISRDKQERLFNLFSKITRLVRKRNYKDKFKFLGTGVSSVVLLKDNSAWKFAEEINKEYPLLKKIKDYHKGSQKNIIKVKGKPEEGIALEIEYIQGDSLESILEKQTPSLEEEKSLLSKNKVIKYASDIINGLIEMHNAGVWHHRDIRPANILIDEKNDRAIIIDLGIATTDKHALPKDNRRYGGVNDLVALGQVIYKMATGEHIFGESNSMEKTIYAPKIKDYRDMVYSDRSGKLLEKHIRQVNEKIQDEKLKTLIKVCLTSKNYHYKRIQRIFEELSD